MYCDKNELKQTLMCSAGQTIRCSLLTWYTRRRRRYRLTSVHVLDCMIARKLTSFLEGALSDRSHIESQPPSSDACFYYTRLRRRVRCRDFTIFVSTASKQKKNLPCLILDTYIHTKARYLQLQTFVRSQRLPISSCPCQLISQISTAGLFSL